MSTFEYWMKRYAKNDLLDFSRSDEGLLWLKLRSIDRKDLLESFCSSLGVKTGKGAVECIWKMLNADDTKKHNCIILCKNVKYMKMPK